MTQDDIDRDTAFSLLGDETRVKIVEALGDATTTPETGIPQLDYVDLQSRVGLQDSGQFNYHLKKLLGTYVAKEQGGYRLRWPGMVLYRTLVAGLFTDEAESELDRIPVDQDCYRCSAGLEAERYETLFRVRCGTCDANYTDVFFPSHGLNGRSDEAVLRALHHRSRLVLDSMTAGQCPWCTNTVTTEIVERDGSLPSEHDTRDLDSYAVFHCTDCTGFQYVPVAQTLLYHPAAISFYHDHSRDLTATPSWELEWAVTDHFTTVTSRDPWAFRVEMPLAEDTLTVELDETLSVVSSHRE